MATLQIRKETSKVWLHIPSNDDPYIVSKLYIKSEGDNIRVVELGGSQRGIYNFADVSVYDIGGIAETFTSASELMQRLEALGYIGFFYEGEVSPSTLISADSGNIIELGSDGKLYAVGGGGSWGSITGNLSDQTDLQNALDSKLDKDITTYPIASFPLADTDKLVLWQGGVPKKLDKSDLYKQTTITVELMTNLTSDFYAPNDLIIHSTDIIRGSGTISLKVENVAYTLGQLITRGNKITVETTTSSVYNLNTTPTNTNWQRPADWLPMPTNITSADQTFVGLHAVIDNSDNYCSFLFTTSAGQYQVDWGDGNITLHNSGTIAQHQYNYATVSNATLSSRGYKQAMVTVTPVSGNLLTCNFQQRFVTTPVQNQAYSSGFLECILSMPNASSGQSIILGGTTIRHNYCEKVDVKTIGNATFLANMFRNCSLLQSVPLFNTINVTNMGSMFFSCSLLQSVPLFNTINVTNMNSMFTSCISLQSVPLFNTINVTDMNNMFWNCYSLQFVPLFNTINVTNMASMLRDCYSLNFIPAFITTSVTTDFTTFANGSSSINRILMSFNRTVALQYCQLSKDALVEIFTNLVDRTSTTSATIDITGNWGASALTASDRLIATNKNWVITG